MTKTRYAFVGTGGRAISFIEPLVTTYRDTNELVAPLRPQPGAHGLL